MVKVSVIIPTCNRLASLQRCVKSVLQQEIGGLEVIIVDDYKEDQTNEISTIFESSPFVKVIKSWHHSPSGARNCGVRASNGQYITFIDDDDIYLPGRLNNMLVFFESNNENYSFVSSGRFFETNDFMSLKTDESQVFGKVKLMDVLKNNGIDIGFMMRRSFFIELGGFDESFNSLEDWDIILRALSIKDGYKIERMDYAVNSELNRNRVSLTQEVSRNKLADKYKFKFGHSWYYENKLIGLSEMNEFNYKIFLNAIYYSRSTLPFRVILKFALRRLSKKS